MTSLKQYIQIIPIIYIILYTYIYIYIYVYYIYMYIIYIYIYNGDNLDICFVNISPITSHMPLAACTTHRNHGPHNVYLITSPVHLKHHKTHGQRMITGDIWLTELQGCLIWRWDQWDIMYYCRCRCRILCWWEPKKTLTRQAFTKLHPPYGIHLGYSLAIKPGNPPIKIWRMFNCYVWLPGYIVRLDMTSWSSRKHQTYSKIIYVPIWFLYVNIL